MYLTGEESMTPGMWITQDITRDAGEPAFPGERILLFKARGTAARRVRIRRAGQRPQRPGGCVADH